MYLRFSSVVEVGDKEFKAGDKGEVDDETGKTLVLLRVAREVPRPAPTQAMGRPVPPAGRVSAEGDIVPPPEPKKKGLFGRKKSG